MQTHKTIPMEIQAQKTVVISVDLKLYDQTRSARYLATTT